MQLSTALGGILGACFAICVQLPKGAGKCNWGYKGSTYLLSYPFVSCCLSGRQGFLGRYIYLLIDRLNSWKKCLVAFLFF